MPVEHFGGEINAGEVASRDSRQGSRTFYVDVDALGFSFFI
jgi:hypothetical protein